MDVINIFYLFVLGPNREAVRSCLTASLQARHLPIGWYGRNSSPEVFHFIRAYILNSSQTAIVFAVIHLEINDLLPPLATVLH